MEHKNKFVLRIMEHKNKFVKSLCIAAFLSILCLPQINSKAMAQAPVPTLDKLNKDGVTIPDSDPEQVYPESAYTLTEIENADPENLPQNAITLYDKNEDGTVTPKYYLVNLKDSVTNIGSGDSTKYFEWTQNSKGNLELKEVSAPTEGKTTITAKYDTSNPQNRYPNSSDNSSKIISGTFLNQTTGSTSGRQYGGAIYNSGTNAKLGAINADFIGNYVSSTGDWIFGGAIYNEHNGIIGNITGDFIGNYASSVNDYAYAGAIYNYGTIGDITGDFISNYTSSRYYAYGGAIYNEVRTIGDITGDFIGNYASSTSSYAEGGAIYNYRRATIGDITGDFIGNYASSTSSYAEGGAIYNDGDRDSATIGNITGDFIGNYASGSYARGGAIYNYNCATIGNITGDFIGNYASSTSGYGNGGAIGNYIGTIGDITGDFIGNYSVSTNSRAGSGAIGNSNGTIGDITGDFIGNYSVSTNSRADSGAIYNNEGTIGNITGDFIGNYVVSTNSSGFGGAIYNIGTISDITGDFIGNYATGSSATYGGAIYNSGTIGDITGDFIGNYASSSNSFAIGGAIYNSGSIALIGDIRGDFIGNYASSTDSSAYGGAIFHYGAIGKLDDEGNLVGGIYGSFINNYTKTESDSQLALGGAVYTGDDMNFIADNQTNYFSGNYTEDYRGKINNAIFVQTSSSSSPTIKLQAQNNGIIIFDDQIDGGKIVNNKETGKYEIDRTKQYNLSVTGDSTGKVILNNDIINANISLDNTNLYLGREDVFDKSVSLSLNSGSIYLNNQSVGTMHVPTLNLNGNTNISVDADLANKSMDRITAVNYNIKDGAMLNVNNVVLLSDAKEDVTNIQFADDELASNVAFTGASPIAYSPIWKYDVSYNPDDGFFSFVRGAASSGNASDAFNPSVLASPVATQAGAYTTQLQTFNYAFQHADTFMNIPYIERLAIINEGKYALSPTGDATDVGTYSPLLLKEESAGFWVKPYASFENVPLKNGPKVSNINYGTLVGYDSPLQSISNGFERVLTGYIGYNGASQRYSGVDAYQNGGLLGGTATFYKGNFFNATTLSVGASAGDASTMYGSENYTMLLAGLGNKTGYNFEFFDGGMILQPSMLISYTFVNTFDYTNGAGVRIESDPMHAIQLAPGIKLIGNTKNGWQPYIGVSMVWNLLDESKVTADSVRLPEMSIKPYVQYGVGIQKRFKDKFLAFGQAMIHNGGRNGVSLSAGLRWKIGRE